jgi:hypothetical protein
MFLPEPPFVARSISNKEMGRPPERTPSPEKLSSMTTACFKIEIVCARYNVTNTLYL